MALYKQLALGAGLAALLSTAAHADLSGKVIKLKDPQIVKQFDALDKSKNSEENHPA